MEQALVFGESGLIGRCVVETLERTGSKVFARKKIDWPNRVLAEQQIEKTVKDFFKHSAGSDWSIFWLAGKGGFGVPAEQYEFDAYIFEKFVNCVSTFRHGRGIIVIASSAGAVYGSSKAGVIDENSLLNPDSEYGRNKSRQEVIGQEFAKNTNCKVLIARISTVYGPGADHVNGFGLINSICRADVFHNVVDLFVPLETSRNYIYSKDAGELIVYHSSMIFGSNDLVSIRNIVSPWSTSIAEVLHESSRVFKRRIRYLSRIDERKSTYGERFDIKSLNAPQVEAYSYTSLASGIKQTRESILLDLQLISQE